MESTSSSALKLRVATFNIRNTTDRYAERKSMIQECLGQVNADIIGFQEVAFREGFDQVPALKEGYGDRKMTDHKCKLQYPHEFWKKSDDPEFVLDGNLVLHDEKYEVLSSSILNLSHDRSVQKRLLNIDGHRVWMVNTHFHHLKEDFQIRLIAAVAITVWVEKEQEENDTVFITLDMNADRDSSSYKAFTSAGYSSAHQVANGDDPAFTFPTGLKAPFMDPDSHLSADYVFYKGPLTATKSEIFGNKAHPADSTMYPSDHYGIWADFTFDN